MAECLMGALKCTRDTSAGSTKLKNVGAIFPDCFTIWPRKVETNEKTKKKVEKALKS